MLKGSFAQTNEVWPGTHNPNTPLDIYPASKVSSLDLGGQYWIKNKGKVHLALSGEFSNFRPGSDGSPWERQNQLIIGLGGQVEKTSRIFVEYFNTQGFSPLNFFSGGNMEDLGETHSDRDATSNSVVAGVLFSI